MSSTRYARALEALDSELRVRFAAAATSFGALTAPDVALAPARDHTHGDFATAAALAAGKQWKRNPMEIAQRVVAEGTARMAGVATVEAKPPGFINLRMAPAFWVDVVREALERGDEYGRSDVLEATGPILLEFVSANPTGPLNVVQGRSGSLGATLASMLRFAGAKVTTETYVNDSGAQLDLLADSLYARYATLLGRDTALPADGYQGDDLIALAERLRERDGDRWLHAPEEERRAALARFGRDAILAQQREDLERFGVVFDNWFLESSLYASGKVDEVADWLLARGVAYELDGAVSLRRSTRSLSSPNCVERSHTAPSNS